MIGLLFRSFEARLKKATFRRRLQYSIEHLWLISQKNDSYIVFFLAYKADFL
jgi:hypothetical protein